MSHWHTEKTIGNIKKRCKDVGQSARACISVHFHTLFSKNHQCNKRFWMSELFIPSYGAISHCGKKQGATLSFDISKMTGTKTIVLFFLIWTMRMSKRHTPLSQHQNWNSFGCIMPHIYYKNQKTHKQMRGRVAFFLESSRKTKSLQASNLFPPLHQLWTISSDASFVFSGWSVCSINETVHITFAFFDLFSNLCQESEKCRTVCSSFLSFQVIQKIIFFKMLKHWYQKSCNMREDH